MKKIIKITTFLLIALFSFSMQVSANVKTMIIDGREVTCVKDPSTGLYLQEGTGLECPSGSENDGINSDGTINPGAEDNPVYNGGGVGNGTNQVPNLQDYVDQFEEEKQVQEGTNIYEHTCSNPNVLNAMRIIGWVVLVVKIVAPLFIIVFGMIDFGKAVTSNDEGALSKATYGLIRRVIAGIAIFFIPSILLAFIELVGIDTTDFGVCSECILNLSTCDDAVSENDVKMNDNTSNDSSGLFEGAERVDNNSGARRDTTTNSNGTIHQTENGSGGTFGNTQNNNSGARRDTTTNSSGTIHQTENGSGGTFGR